MNSHSTDRSAGSSPWSDLVLDGQLLQCVSPEVALIHRPLHRSDSVCFLRNFCRVDEASTMTIAYVRV